MPKLFLILTIIFFSIGLYSVANASAQNIAGYVYSQDAGWISLNCSNTNSCNSISYSVAEDNAGNLLGYGYSETGGWVNFNPNYGGVKIDSAGNISGWGFSENVGWASLDGSKIVSASDLQNEITVVSSQVSNNNLSADSEMSLLNSLCNKFFSASACD